MRVVKDNHAGNVITVRLNDAADPCNNDYNDKEDIDDININNKCLMNLISSDLDSDNSNSNSDDNGDSNSNLDNNDDSPPTLERWDSSDSKDEATSDSNEEDEDTDGHFTNYKEHTTMYPKENEDQEPPDFDSVNSLEILRGTHIMRTNTKDPPQEPNHLLLHNNKGNTLYIHLKCEDIKSNL